MRAELSQELRELTQLIGNVEGKLNLSSDPDVIEAFIFELSALQSRRRSVLRKAKEMGL